MRRVPPGQDSKAIVLSGRLFQRLLAAYPEAHRREYGPAMAQLFRDQCRDAWRASRGWGLTALWLRVLPDLVKTSVLEHLSTLKGRINMLERIGTILRPRSAPLFVFSAVFVVVFLFVVITSTLVTFILPESYASTARIKLNQDATEVAGKAGPSAPSPVYDPYFIQTEFEIIQSELILGKVISALDLNTVWGKKYVYSSPLKTSETVALLKSRLDLRPVRNTSLIEIRVFSEQPAEAAMLANAVADAFQEYRQDQQRRLLLGTAQAAEEEIKQQASRVATLQEKVAQWRKDLNVPSPEPPPDALLAKYQPYWEAKRQADVANRFLDELSMKNESARLESASPKIALVEIVDRAVPGLRPVRPNKPLNICLGIIGGMFLASVAGAAMAGLAALIRRKSRGRGTPPRTGAAPPPNLPHAEGRSTKSAADKVTGILWMGVGVPLSALVLVMLLWFLIFQQASVTADLLFLPVLGFIWAGNTVLGYSLWRGKRWARICLGVEGCLFLAYFYFRQGSPVVHCPAWLSATILKVGWPIVGPLPPMVRWVFIPLGLASIGALLWPRKEAAASPC